MKKLDVLKNILDNEVLEYLESECPTSEHIEVETNICFVDDGEYDARDMSLTTSPTTTGTGTTSRTTS